MGELTTLPEKEYTVSFDKNGTGATATTTALTSTAPFNGWYSANSDGVKVASNAATPVLVKSVSGYTNADGKWTKTTATTLYAGFGSQPSITLPTIKKTGYTHISEAEFNKTYKSALEQQEKVNEEKEF